MKIQKTMLRFTFSLIFFFALFGKSYGQTNCNLVYGTAIDYVPCATGQGDSLGSFVLSIFNTACSCSGPWTYEVFQSQGIGSSTTNGPILFSSPSPVFNTSSEVWNLPAGNYVARISNVNGICASTNNNNGSSSSIFPFSFTNPSPIVLSGNISNGFFCHYINDGSIDLTTGGGTPGYTYSWTGPSGFTAISDDLSGLAPGTYTLTVTDANGCYTTASWQINPPPPLTITEVHIDPLCHDDDNGSITVTFNGGTPGYTITGIGTPVTTPPGPNSHTYTGLTAGSYTIRVTDSGVCTDSTTILLVNPLDIELSATTTPVSCFGGNDGRIIFNASGGAGTLSYSTVPASSSGTFAEGSLSIIPNLSAGIYTLTITDTNGCQDSITVIVNEPDPINISLNCIYPSCYGATGAIHITVSGGTPLYDYSWSGPNGFTSSLPDLIGIAPGTYCVTVTDMNGCSDSACCQIIEHPILTSTLTQTNPLCHDDANGSITVTVNGGTPGYTIYIDGGAPVIIPLGQNSHTFLDLAAGFYGITVTCAMGCVLSNSIVLMNPQAITLNATTTPVNCFGGNDGTIFFTASGGTGALSYSTVPASSSGTVVAGNNTISNLSAGIYTLTITDTNGCQESITVLVSEPVSILLTGIPSQVLCYDNNGGAIDITVGGGTPGSYLWTGPGITPSNQTNQDQSELTPGIYCVTVTDANGCSESTCWQINPSPPLLTITEIHTDPLCHDDANGSITVTVDGGTPGYTITGIGAPVIIATGPNSHTFSNLAAGNYVITITDAYGCSASLEQIDIMAPQALTLTGVVSENDIDVTASGGTPNYVYSWSNGSGLEDQQDLISGIYILIVTDTNGCQVADTFDVNNASLYENSNESLLLFPNPSAEFLNIHISPSMENNRFVVFDCLGRTVGSGILESKETIISVKHLANGIYHFQTETQRVQFVVAH